MVLVHIVLFYHCCIQTIQLLTQYFSRLFSKYRPLIVYFRPFHIAIQI